LAQSAFTVQALPTPQALQLPPQSTSVSVPFFTPSLHETGEHKPPAHAPLVQSVTLPQRRPLAHFGHVLPPQSTSLSAPFLIPSLQLGCAQVPAVHRPLMQSAALTHIFPGRHGEQGPPQSMSLSPLSFIPLAQVEPTHC
jgi:hypothetical protein